MGDDGAAERAKLAAAQAEEEAMLQDPWEIFKQRQAQDTEAMAPAVLVARLKAQLCVFVGITAPVRAGLGRLESLSLSSPQ
jgi:hypothetical protein